MDWAELMAHVQAERWTDVHVMMDRATMDQLQDLAGATELVQRALRIHGSAKYMEQNGIKP